MTSFELRDGSCYRLRNAAVSDRAGINRSTSIPLAQLTPEQRAVTVLGESRLLKGCDFPFQTTTGDHFLEVMSSSLEEQDLHGFVPRGRPLSDRPAAQDGLPRHEPRFRGRRPGPEGARLGLLTAARESTISLCPRQSLPTHWAAQYPSRHPRRVSGTRAHSGQSEAGSAGAGRPCPR
jgi:hypothetical protein